MGVQERALVMSLFKSVAVEESSEAKKCVGRNRNGKAKGRFLCLG
jgi:hypothetical protein